MPSEGRPGCLQVSPAVPTASHLTRGRTALSHLRSGAPVVNTVSASKVGSKDHAGPFYLRPVSVSSWSLSNFTRCRLNVLLPSRWPQWARAFCGHHDSPVGRAPLPLCSGQAGSWEPVAPETGGRCRRGPHLRPRLTALLGSLVAGLHGRTEDVVLCSNRSPYLRIQVINFS